jgi:hypothetical protein
MEPIGKAFRRVVNGAAGSIPYFYSTLVDECS